VTTHLLPLSPDAAIALFTFGVLLIYVELNRPGSILPGALGLLISLLSIAEILPTHPNLYGAFLLFIAASLLLLNMRSARFQRSIIPTLLLVFGFQHLVRNPAYPRIHIAISLVCGLILGLSSSVLAAIAHRARVNKGLDLKRARTSRPGAF